MVFFTKLIESNATIGKINNRNILFTKIKRGIFMILKKVWFIVIVQFLFDDVRSKSLILVLYVGVVCFLEIKHKPFAYDILNFMNYYSTLTVLSSICWKLFAFALMKDFWNSFSDVWIVFMNCVFLIYSNIVMIKSKKREAFKLFLGNTNILDKFIINLQFFRFQRLYQGKISFFI